MTVVPHSKFLQQAARIQKNNCVLSLHNSVFMELGLKQRSKYLAKNFFFLERLGVQTKRKDNGNMIEWEYLQAQKANK